MCSILDSRIDADSYEKWKRAVLPKAYCSKKNIQANLNRFGDIGYLDDIKSYTEESQCVVKTEIKSKIASMDNIFIDLTEAEITDIQDILDDDNDESDPPSDKNVQIKPNEICSDSNENMQSTFDGDIDAFGGLDQSTDGNDNSDWAGVDASIVLNSQIGMVEDSVIYLSGDDPLPIPFTSKMKEVEDQELGSDIAAQNNVSTVGHQNIYSETDSNMDEYYAPLESELGSDIADQNNVSTIGDQNMYSETSSHMPAQIETASPFFSPPLQSFQHPLLPRIFDNLYQPLMDMPQRVVDTIHPDPNDYLNVMNQHFAGKCFFVSFF